jgi:2-polyprenyl-3-methyl-5-hydroxy-6-metoxy-1,4-benzoquinol methylase
LKNSIIKNNFYKIEINKWDFFRTGNLIKLFIDDKELPFLYRKTIKKISKKGKFTRFFAIGKFFIFILLDKNNGLKILHRDCGSYHKNCFNVKPFKYCNGPLISPEKTLNKIIKIQKIFHKEGISFNCEEEIFPVVITDRANGIKKEFYSYITNTDIDFSRMMENIDNIQEISLKNIDVIWNKRKIGRRLLRSETRKRANYIITNKGDIKLIDIDPKYFFKESKIEDELKEEIIKEGQFPYKKRKHQYQSIDEEKMNGIRNMKYRYSILNLPNSFKGKKVLDIGCNIGMICKEAKKRGAELCVGIDYREETIKVAQKYLKFKKYEDIKLITFDIDKGVDKLISLIGPDKFDYVFALSIWKHVDKTKLYDIINYYCKEKLWFEGHNKQSKSFFDKELLKNLKFSKIDFLGNTKDRGIRPNFCLGI